MMSLALMISRGIVLSRDVEDASLDDLDGFTLLKESFGNEVERLFVSQVCPFSLARILGHIHDGEPSRRQ